MCASKHYSLSPNVRATKNYLAEAFSNFKSSSPRDSFTSSSNRAGGIFRGCWCGPCQIPRTCVAASGRVQGPAAWRLESNAKLDNKRRVSDNQYIILRSIIYTPEYILKWVWGLCWWYIPPLNNTAGSKYPIIVLSLEGRTLLSNLCWQLCYIISS